MQILSLGCYDVRLMLTPSVGDANQNRARDGDFSDSRRVIGNLVLSSLTGTPVKEKRGFAPKSFVQGISRAGTFW